MQVLYSWLRELSGTPKSPEDLGLVLTTLGLAVDSMTYLGEGFEEMQVGKIESASSHPNADTLTLLEVSTGSQKHRIVCGAKNMKAGDKVAVVLAGTVLPNGMKIEKRKIRGIASEGMCCSERELGLGEDHSGILILPPDTAVGCPLAEAIGRNDWILELDVTANRPDCLSHVGVAREIAACEGRGLDLPEIRLSEAGESAAERISVEISDPDLCQRYAARVMTGVTLGPSPKWMTDRLEACGIRSINNVVDVTNYVLLEYGHPLHAFDLARIDQSRIVVRRARAGEKITSLDGEERDLDPDMLVIADALKPVAIAGVIGGANSEVSGETRELLIESAYFHPPSIRNTRKKLGLSTEASYRFERGCDYHGLITALDRTAELLVEVAGGEVLPGRVDVTAVPPSGPDPAETADVPIRLSRIPKVLGVDVSGDQVELILQSLGFQTEEQGDGFLARVPSYRKDISREEDLIEEISRVYGYDRIPSTFAGGRVRAPEPDRDVLLENVVRRLLIAAGYSEALNYSFQGEDFLDRLGLAADDPRRDMIRLMNPLSVAESGMRTTLVPGLLGALSLNARRGNPEAALFEIAAVFTRGDDGRVVERPMVSGTAMGAAKAWWAKEEKERDFFDMKGCVEALLSGLRVTEYRFAAEEVPFLHPGRSAAVLVDGERTGYLGELLPSVAEDLDLRGRAVLFELELDRLASHAEFEAREFRPPSVFPAMTRDVALVLERKTASRDVEQVIRGKAGSLLESVSMFDLYEGPGLPEGKRSLAYRLVFRSADETLTDSRVNTAMDRIVRSLEHQLGARLRE